MDKKGLPLYLLKIFEEYSDENHLLTHKMIIDLISSKYGVTYERKAIASCIEFLIDLDYDIIKNPTGGCFLASRAFDKSEVSYIIDALMSSKSIGAKRTKELAKKISANLSTYERQSFKYVYKSDEINKTDNKNILYNISIINEAIEKNKKISFKYLSYDKYGNKTLSKDGRSYVVSPYYLVNSNGRYYLICSFSSKIGHFNNFRVDYLLNIKIEEESREPIESIKEEYKDFSISNYINEHIYCFGGDSINAKLVLKDENAVRYIIDWFGKSAFISYEKDTIYADITCNEQALFYWLMQYGEHVTAISPMSLVSRVIDTIKDMEKRYKRVKKGKKL